MKPLSFCQECKPSFATSQVQLANRRRNAANFPTVRPHACTNCGSTDWMTSDAFVPGAGQVLDTPGKNPRWWEFWK